MSTKPEDRRKSLGIGNAVPEREDILKGKYG